MSLNSPKISIITVCLNSEKTIEQTIESVISQSYDNIEYIIIDGLSTDGTLELIEKYKTKIDLVVSEKDSGIYNAMNKGLKLMSGDVALFLNAGDYLFDDKVISDVADIFVKRPEIELLYGNMLRSFRGKNQVRKHNNTNRVFFSCSMISHQVIFARREVFSAYGDFNEAYTIAADYDWLLNFFFKKEIADKKYYLDRIISVVDITGVSSKPQRYLKQLIKVKLKYFSPLELLLYYPLCSIKQRVLKHFGEDRV